MPSLNGTLKLITEVDVQMPVTIKDIEVRELDDKKFRAVKGDIQFTAEKAADSLKGWAREYKKSVLGKRMKDKKAKEADAVVKPDSAKEAGKTEKPQTAA